MSSIITLGTIGTLGTLVTIWRNTCTIGNINYVLAFFPVVAISTNFSTKTLRYKGSKKIRITKTLSVCKMAENIFEVTFFFVE
jgi:hypothetical protein